ncbi:hypothetical protein Tco_1249702, partial [Tanacetum coccineum]
WDFIHYVQQKKEVIQYPRFTKLIIADIIEKYESIPNRLEEEYHVIKDDTPFDYEKEFVRVDIPMIQPQLVESAQGANRTPSATRTPNPANVVQRKRKGKQVVGETKREDIHEATLIRLALHKTAKIVEEQENMVAVQEKILKDDVDKIVEREDEESYASEFADFVFLDEEDSSTRIEPESHKENLETIDDDEEKKDDKKDDDDDDDDDNDKALIRTRRTGSLKTRTKKMHTLR